MTDFGTVAVGLMLTRTIRVGENRVITFMGEELQVYETPSMIADVEYACRDLLHENLPEGLDSVGTLVEFRHLAATPQNEEVTVRVLIDERVGRRVRFICEVRDAAELVGEGIHDRVIIDVERHRTRVLQKKARLRAVKSAPD